MGSDSAKLLGVYSLPSYVKVSGRGPKYASSMALRPSCHAGVSLPFLFLRGVDVCLEHLVYLAELGQLGAVVETLVYLLRNDAVLLDGVRYVMCGTADGKVQRAVQAHVLDGLLEVDVTYDPHLRELDLRAAGTQDLLLEERYGREAPAGAAAGLVGDGHRLHRLRVGELVALGGLLLVLCRRRDCGAGQNRCQKHR